MNRKILIVEDQLNEAGQLSMMLEKANYNVCGVARSIDDAERLIDIEKPGLVLLNIFLTTGKRTGIELAEKLRLSNIAFIYLSANSIEEILNAVKSTHPNGFLLKPFREKDLLVALEIAHYHHEHGMESKLRKEALVQKQLKEITNEKVGWEQKLVKIAQTLQPIISFDYMAAGYRVEGDILPYNALHFLRIGYNEYQVMSIEGLQTVANLKLNEIRSLQANTFVEPAVEFYNGEIFKKLCSAPSMRKFVSETFDMNSLLSFHLKIDREFFFSFYSRRPDTYSDEHIAFYQRMQQALTESVGQMLKMERLPPVENVVRVLPKSADGNNKNSIFKGIIGQSHLLLNVFDLVSQVAPGDTSVLITGESGTGKERIADSIHTLSPRKAYPLVKVNCAALPANLIESELFGHEKGAFTGALEKRIGRFEQAHNGTIFLDEIGDMPMETQVKMLRVLQEKEIDRIGGKAPIKVNLRIIAATNKNLEKEVSEGRFRLDLYYRLNVFPIHLPSLAERREDIVLLAKHFVGHYSRKLGKNVLSLSDSALKCLLSYNWPGNIRELENIVERSILMTKGTVVEDIVLPNTGFNQHNNQPETRRMKTIFENERDYIIAVLNKCNGKIGGIGGAAEILDIPPTTLNSKMKKLEITRKHLSVN